MSPRRLYPWQVHGCWMADESPHGLAAGVGPSYLLDPRPRRLRWGAVSLAAPAWLAASAVFVVAMPSGVVAVAMA